MKVFHLVKDLVLNLCITFSAQAAMGRNSSQAVIESTPSTAAIIERSPVPVPMSSTCTLTSKVWSSAYTVLHPAPPPQLLSWLVWQLSARPCTMDNVDFCCLNLIHKNLVSWKQILNSKSKFLTYLSCMFLNQNVTNLKQSLLKLYNNLENAMWITLWWDIFLQNNVHINQIHTFSNM